MKPALILANEIVGREISSWGLSIINENHSITIRSSGVLLR